MVVSSKWTATQHYPPQPQLCTAPRKNVSQHYTQNTGVILGPVPVYSLWCGSGQSLPAASSQSCFFLLNPFRTVFLFSMLCIYYLLLVVCETDLEVLMLLVRPFMVILKIVTI